MMKTLLLCLALLIGLSDGSIVIFYGSPLVIVSPKEITVEGIPIPVEEVKAMRYVPDNMVM